MPARGSVKRKKAVGMSASSTEPLWTPFTHGYVFWELETAKHHPPGPDDIEGLRQWLEGFQLSHAEHPDVISEPPNFENRGGTVAGALDRLLPDHPARPMLKMMLQSM